MSKGVYVGVGGKAKKVKKIYVGVDGKARKVKKGYIGVGGKAKLFWSGSNGTDIPNPPDVTLNRGAFWQSIGTTEDYMLIGGGLFHLAEWNNETVFAYNKDFVKTRVADIDFSYEGYFPGHAIGGGKERVYFLPENGKNVSCYNNSLTQTINTIPLRETDDYGTYTDLDVVIEGNNGVAYIMGIDAYQVSSSGTLSKWYTYSDIGHIYRPRTCYVDGYIIVVNASPSEVWRINSYGTRSKILSDYYYFPWYMGKINSNSAIIVYETCSRADTITTSGTFRESIPTTLIKENGKENGYSYNQNWQGEGAEFPNGVIIRGNFDKDILKIDSSLTQKCYSNDTLIDLKTDISRGKYFKNNVCFAGGRRVVDKNDSNKDIIYDVVEVINCENLI